MKNMKVLLLSLCLACTTAMAQTPAAGKAGDGHSVETAVQLPNAKSETQGVTLEYQWLKKNYPGWKKKGQSLIKGNGDSKRYDLIEIVSDSGETKSIYFDITPFFGKY